MTEIFFLSGLMNGLLLPIVAGTTLVAAKLKVGEAARRAERQFLATLVVMTIITLRTVITSDDVWLIHTATLAIMIVGALVVPNQEATVAI